MDKLIAAEDLLCEPRVVEAYFQLIQPKWARGINRRLKITSNMSMADVAFEMRNATVGKESRDMPGGWNRIVGELVGHGDTGSLLLAEPKHWIVAAVVVWEANNGKVDKSTINPYGGED